MTTGNKCKVKDDLVNQLVALNSKLNTLSPALLRSEQARAKVQEQRERLYVEIKRHRAKGHDGKPCPAIRARTDPVSCWSLLSDQVALVLSKELYYHLLATTHSEKIIAAAISIVHALSIRTYERELGDRCGSDSSRCDSVKLLAVHFGHQQTPIAQASP